MSLVAFFVTFAAVPIIIAHTLARPSRAIRALGIGHALTFGLAWLSLLDPVPADATFLKVFSQTPALASAFRSAVCIRSTLSCNRLVLLEKFQTLKLLSNTSEDSLTASYKRYVQTKIKCILKLIV